MRIPRQAAVCACLLVAGCSSMHGVADAPMPDARAIVLANKNRLWKDPDSIKNASITAPFRNQIFSQGWLVCVRANAKNSFGGYTGESDSLIGLSGPTVLYEKAVGACGELPHSPFPEIEAKR